jgi:hypothetical protein
MQLNQSQPIYVRSTKPSSTKTPNRKQKKCKYIALHLTVPSADALAMFAPVVE